MVKNDYIKRKRKIGIERKNIRWYNIAMNAFTKMHLKTYLEVERIKYEQKI